MSRKKILVSCIMPTRNRRRFVLKAIEYFLRQDYPCKELILVDDGEDSVSDMVPSDARVRYINPGNQITIGMKRNLACQEANGEVILHWDDDDWYANWRISYQVRQLLQNRADVCGTSKILHYDPIARRGWVYKYLQGKEKLWVGGNSLCYWKRFWQRNPFLNINVGEDSSFLWTSQPKQVFSLARADFLVALIHPDNVSQKKADPSWAACSESRIQRLIGNDWSFYQSLHVASTSRLDIIRSRVSHLPLRDKPKSEIAVVVTCHEPHLKWLSSALGSIDRQIPAPAERIIAFDRCEPPALSAQWRTITGDWGHPSYGRNAGLAATTTPWVIFWDADNIMPDGYIAAMQHAINVGDRDMAIAYPDIQYCDEQLTPRSLWRTPAWDYWDMRGHNCVDTASAWRREALELVGGWSAGNDATFEDYALALSITSAGWKANKVNGPPIIMRVHSGSRSQTCHRQDRTLYHLWQARSLAIVSLLAGRENVFDRWLQFLLHAELPPKASLYVIDNSGRSEFNRMAFDACYRIAKERGLVHLDFSTFGQAYPAEWPGAEFNLDELVRRRHLHVAQLYNLLFPRISEDLILTLEDDIEPPLDAVRKLGEDIGWTERGKIGAVAGAYSMPEDPSLVCAGQGRERWGPAVPWSQLPTEPIDVSFVGGGCTIWARWALQSQPVNFPWDKLLGWDAGLCLQIKRRGFRVRLHGGVRCLHHTHGQIINQ
jgi:glycosyltransferase involved in cell wall biosynthesis